VNDKLVVNFALPEIKQDAESIRIARLLGYILADGNINIRKGRFKDGRGYWYNGTKARIRIFNADKEVLTQAKEDFEYEFKVKAKRYMRKDCNCEIVETKHQRIVNKFVELGIPAGNKSSIIRVPPLVFQSSNEFKAQFINALFCCDGYIPKTGRYIDYSSKSKKFLQDLQLLLSYFRIESTIKPKLAKLNGKEFKNYRLFITDNNSVENFKKIGFIIKFKQERLNNHKRNNTPKRKTHYLNNQLVCKRIKAITPFENIHEVYDLTVEKNHSFIANGIISHNSGKSYTLGVIAEGMANLDSDIKQNLSIILLDTMGVYWTMKYPNKKEAAELKEWNMNAKGFDVQIYTPSAFFQEYTEKGIPTDFPFALQPKELTPEDWCMTFGIKITDPMGVLIERTLNVLEEKEQYSIQDIIDELEKHNESNDIKEAVKNRFLNVLSWGIFEEKGTKIEDLALAGNIAILDLSCYATMPNGWSIKCLVVGLIAKKLFQQRMLVRKNEEFAQLHSSMRYFGTEETKQEFPLVWLILDEAHEFLPKIGKTTASDPLITILREGRQPGISLILATQQPGKIHSDVMTQSDTVLSHRITAKVDTEALGALMQSYMREGLDVQLDKLPRTKGSALIFDDTNEKLYPIKIRPRFTWHGGESPTALHEEKKRLI
jgi:hypothetical protein